MNVFGLTGGIASGKSTVASFFRERGFPVLDSDRIARDVVAVGSPGLAAVRDAFGPSFMLPGGELDRVKLGTLIFSDREARRRLNAIIHPLVLEKTGLELRKLEKAGQSLALLDIPLLFEARDPADFSGVIVVYVDPETQRKRLMARNALTPEEADARIRSQIPLEDKARKATWIIDNRGALSETKAQTLLLADRLLWESAH